MEKLNLTASMKQFLSNNAPRRAYNAVVPDAKEDQLQSVTSIAFNEGRTLKDWVIEHKDRALLTAQLVLLNWEKVQQSIALTGSINEEPVSREMVQMVDRCVQNARSDLMTVEWLLNDADPDTLRKDVLIETLYQKALKGDIRAIQYFIDRVDGKIPEMKVQEVDYDSTYSVYQIVHSLFDKQLNVLNSGYGTKMCCCSRRAGKTRLAAAILLIESLRTTNCTCMYIGETMKLAEGILGTAMDEIITLCGLRDSKGNRLNWKRLENGSEIIIRGLSNTKDPDQIRGHKCKVIVIDEFFHLKSDLLQYMVEEVLEPMQLDYADDYKLIFIGTPPDVKGTYGEKQWNELQVPKFLWTWEDNPHIKNGMRYIEDKAAEKGLTIDSPQIQREYFARWVYDDEVLLYPDYYIWKEVVPRFDIDRIVCGVDYGTDANNSIIGIAWDSAHRRGFEIFNSKFNRLTTPSTMTQFEYLRCEMKQLWEFALDFWPGLKPEDANSRIVWAADNSDGQLTEELQWNLKCKYPELTLNIGIAHKHDAVLMRDKIRDILRTGALLLKDGGKTAEECEMTILKRDAQGNVTQQLDDKAYHPDLLPAMRYALWPILGLEILDNGRSKQENSAYGQEDHVV